MMKREFLPVTARGFYRTIETTDKIYVVTVDSHAPTITSFCKDSSGTCTILRIRRAERCGGSPVVLDGRICVCLRERLSRCWGCPGLHHLINLISGRSSVPDRIRVRGRLDE